MNPPPLPEGWRPHALPSTHLQRNALPLQEVVRATLEMQRFTPGLFAAIDYNYSSTKKVRLGGKTSGSVVSNPALLMIVGGNNIPQLWAFTQTCSQELAGPYLQSCRLRWAMLQEPVTLPDGWTQPEGGPAIFSHLLRGVQSTPTVFSRAPQLPPVSPPRADPTLRGVQRPLDTPLPRRTTSPTRA